MTNWEKVNNVIYGLDPNMIKCVVCRKWWDHIVEQEIIEVQTFQKSNFTREIHGKLVAPWRFGILPDVCPICRLEEMLEKEKASKSNRVKKQKHDKQERMRVMNVAIPKFKRGGCYPRQ